MSAALQPRGRLPIRHLRHVPHGPLLEGARSGKDVKFLEPVITCGIFIYLSNSSGCTEFQVVYILDLNNAVPLLAGIFEGVCGFTVRSV